MNNLVMLALWVLVGLLAGWLARVVVTHGGYGMREDLFLGLVGSLLGGGIVWSLGASPDAGVVAAAGVAFVGAAIVIVLQRKIWLAIA
jgi:uncharacterized membrane protein YeaQ/YmgE (transglycosylase-associated protein family)